MNEEAKKKVSEKNKAWWSSLTEKEKLAHTQRISTGMRELWRNRTPEQKRDIARKISEARKGIRHGTKG